MKRMLLAAGIALSIAFAGCVTPGVKLQIPPPTQLVADICPIVNADLDLLAGLPVLNADQQLLLDKTIIPGNKRVCGALVAVDVSDLQAFNATIFPALIGIVAAVPAIPNQPLVLLALQLAQPIVTQIVNAALAAAVPTTPASGVVATSAPATAGAP